MKNTTTLPLSIATTSVMQPKQRITPQSLHILDFIHRFRHVTSRHVQLSLRHASVRTTLNQLTLLRAKGYIERRYSNADRVAHRQASYFLTPEGLALLKARNPERRFRRKRSIDIDANMGERSIERHHTVADVYAHFKRHYDGHFQFYTAFDLVRLENIPDEVPDGCVKVMLPDRGTQYYFVEAFGWGRSNQLQRRRLASYLHYAESEPLPRKRMPRLFIVAPGKLIQGRLNVQMGRMLKESFADNLKVHTTTQGLLDCEKLSIWRNLGY
jgi:DNA-binding MarR family transcriptional regulator